MATEKIYWIEGAVEGEKDSGWYVIRDRNGTLHDGGPYETGDTFTPPITEIIDGQEQVVGEGPEEKVVKVRWPKAKGIRPHVRTKAGRKYWTGNWIYEGIINKQRKVSYWDTYQEAIEAQVRATLGQEQDELDEAAGIVRMKRQGLIVANVVLDYLKDCRSELSEGTMIYKEKFLKDFAKAFPKRKLASIKTAEIKRFLKDISKDRGPSIFHRYHREINALYRYAMVEWEDQVTKNPAKNVKVNGKNKKYRESYIPEDSELQQVIDYAYKNYDKKPQPYNLLIAYRDTWARKNEVFKWTWKDHIDWDRFDGKGGVRLVSGKSDKYADVWVPMSTELRKCLLNQKERNFGTKWVFEVKAVALKGKKNRFGETAFGGRITDANAMIKDLCKAAGLPKDHWFNFHSIRKNRISSALSEGKPINKVSQFARHTCVSHTTPYIKESTENLLDMVE